MIRSREMAGSRKTNRSKNVWRNKRMSMVFRKMVGGALAVAMVCASLNMSAFASGNERLLSTDAAAATTGSTADITAPAVLTAATTGSTADTTAPDFATSDSTEPNAATTTAPDFATADPTDPTDSPLTPASVSPTVYCDTKEDAYEAVRKIIRDRVNNKDYYGAKITNPDKNYNNYVYDRIYVRYDLFGPYPIMLDDVCDFEEERVWMKPYEGDYMYNLFGDSINSRYFMEDPTVPGDPDVQTYVEYAGKTYKLIEVYLPVITTKEQEDEMDQKVNEILASSAFQKVKDGTNDEKIKVIYDYVKKTVKSATGDRTRPIVHTAYSGLCTSGHQGTCEAYAQAFYRLSREMGVPSRVLMGLDANNHTYNLVLRDDGKWWFIDCSAGIYLKSYKDFKHAELQDRFNTVKFKYNYWNNVKDYTGELVDYARVYRDGEQVIASVDLEELYDLTIADMSAHKGSEYVIRLGSDQCVEMDTRVLDFTIFDTLSGNMVKQNATLDLNGHTLNLRSGGTACLKAIKNGNITVGKAEVYKGNVYGYSGNWSIAADEINDVTVTGLLNGDDRCFFEGADSTKVSNVTVEKLHFWAKNGLVLNGGFTVNACTAADIGDYNIVKDAAGSCRGKVIFKGNNILGRVGNCGEEEPDYTEGVRYTPKPMIVRAVNEDGTQAQFKQNDLIAVNEGTLKYYYNGSAVAAAFDKVYDFAVMNEEANKGVPEADQVTLTQSGKNLVFSYPNEIQITFKYKPDQASLLDDKGAALPLISGKLGVRQGQMLRFKVVPQAGYQCNKVSDGSVLDPDAEGYYSVLCDKAKTVTVTTAAISGGTVNSRIHIYKTDGTLSGNVADKAVISLKSYDRAELGVCKDKAEEGLWEIREISLKPANVENGFATLSENKVTVIIDASKAADLGKKVDLTLKGDFGVRKLSFNVAQNIEKISVKGFKAANGRMETRQAPGTKAVYPITLNKNADASRLALICDPPGCARITKNAKGSPVLEVSTFAEAGDGFLIDTSSIDIRFVDSLDGTKHYGPGYWVNVEESGKPGALTPSVKFDYSSDVDIDLSLALPKAMKDRKNLYYRISAMSAGGDVPEGMVSLVSEYVPSDRTSHSIFLMSDEGAKRGEGHVHKYDVKVMLFQVADSSLPEAELFLPGNRIFESPVKDLKGLETREPKYETNMKLKGKTTSFIAGNKNVVPAVGAFSKDTTFRSLGYARIKETGKNTKDDPDVISFTEDGSGVMLIDTKDLLPGKYTLEAGPVKSDGSLTATASIAFKVKAPVTEIGIEVPASGLYKQDNKGASMKLKWKCISKMGGSEYKPANSKVEWSIDTDNEEIRRAVTVKNGTIKVAKDYIMSDLPENNRFTVTARAVDLGDDSVSATTVPIEILRK